jgi:diguanylate cyclase (GGDEF)-like protein
VILFDIDDFKSLNDTGGHAVGDQVLRELAALLRASVRRDGSLARLSGDEFALLLADTDHESALRVVERLLDAARDFRLEADGVTFDVTLSAGAYSIGPGDSPALALRRADEALYRAKAAGKNRAQPWAPSPVAFIGASRAWSPRIKDALRDDRLDLYLQPIVDLAHEAPVFYEALCRLRTADGSIVAAADWIDHAEQVGLMPAIDLRMIEKAEEVVYAHHVKVFVNISASSVHDDTVLTRLETALRRVPAGSLGIEITEHTALSNPTLAAETLSRFRELGALVAIDDFGVGFTSFTELATLPCDIVKIPAAFTSGSQPSPDTAAIAGAITNIAHHYGKQVVLEGVECPAMARRAKLIGIEYAQGWHYGRPLPAAERVTAALLA